MDDYRAAADFYRVIPARYPPSFPRKRESRRRRDAERHSLLASLSSLLNFSSLPKLRFRYFPALCYNPFHIPAGFL